MRLAAAPAPRPAGVEPAPLPIPLPHVTRALRTSSPHPGHQPLDGWEFRAGSSMVSRGEGTFVAGRRRGDFSDPSHARRRAQSRADLNASHAVTPCTIEMGFDSDDNAAPRCAPVEAGTLPGRLRLWRARTPTPRVATATTGYQSREIATPSPDMLGRRSRDGLTQRWRLATCPRAAATGDDRHRFTIRWHLPRADCTCVGAHVGRARSQTHQKPSPLFGRTE